MNFVDMPPWKRVSSKLTHAGSLFLETRPMLSRAACTFLVALWFVTGLQGQPIQADQANKPSTDALGDPLPDGAIARLGTLRFKHTPARGVVIDAAAYSPDGSKIASVAQTTGSIRLWD